MSEGPSINVDEFRHRPVNELGALLPDKASVEASIKDLSAANVDIATVRVLYGQRGADIFDATGSEHGSAARIVRWLQRIGYDRNILDVYEEALEKGEALLTVPCASADSRHLAGLVLRHGAHGVIYFGTGTVETLTAP